MSKNFTKLQILELLITHPWEFSGFSIVQKIRWTIVLNSFFVQNWLNVSVALQLKNWLNLIQLYVTTDCNGKRYVRLA